MAKPNTDQQTGSTTTNMDTKHDQIMEYIEDHFNCAMNQLISEATKSYKGPKPIAENFAEIEAYLNAPSTTRYLDPNKVSNWKSQRKEHLDRARKTYQKFQEKGLTLKELEAAIRDQKLELVKTLNKKFLKKRYARFVDENTKALLLKIDNEYKEEPDKKSQLKESLRLLAFGLKSKKNKEEELYKELCKDIDGAQQTMMNALIKDLHPKANVQKEPKQLLEAKEVTQPSTTSLQKLHINRIEPPKIIKEKKPSLPKISLVDKPQTQGTSSKPSERRPSGKVKNMAEFKQPLISEEGNPKQDSAHSSCSSGLVNRGRQMIQTCLISIKRMRRHPR